MAFGSFLGFCANLAANNAGWITWRLHVRSAFIPAAPCVFAPRAPSLVHQEAPLRHTMNLFLRLRNSRLRAARDLFNLQAQLWGEESGAGERPVSSAGVQVEHCSSYLQCHSGCLYHNDSARSKYTNLPVHLERPFR